MLKSSIEFRSVREPLMIRPRNFTSAECMERMYFVKLEGVDAFKIYNVVFIDLPLIITILQDLSALNYIPAHDKAFIHLSNRFCAPETDQDMRFKLSINALTKRKATLYVDTNSQANEAKVYYIYPCQQKNY